MDEPVTHKQAERVAFVQLGRNTAYEFILTSILLFGVASIVRWGDRTLGHLAVDPADPCRASARRCGRGVAPRWADPQSVGPGLGRTYESGHLTRHVALRRLSGSGYSAVHDRAAARFGSWRGGGPFTVGPSNRGASGRVRCAPAGTAVVDWGTIRSRDGLHGSHRVDRWHLARGGPPGAVRTVGRWSPDRNGHRGSWHVHRRQREPGPPVRTGRHVWRDALSVGISTRPDAGSSDRGMATTDDPAPPRRVDPPAMRYPTGWTPALRCSALEATELLSATDQRSITGRHDHEHSPI